MASTVGGLFDEYSTLSLAEKAQASAAIGNILIDNFIYDSGAGGTSGNDVYVITKSGVNPPGSAGTDVLITDESVTLSGGIEIGLLTGDKNLNLKGNSGNNLLIGNDGNNSINGGSGTDTIFGGGGNDTLKGSSAADSLNGGMGNDCIDGASGNDCIDGGMGNDCIMGGSGNDTIFSGDNDDTVDGGSGADCIMGGMGNDCIAGGSGNDTINAGNGNDSVSGGSGADIFVFTSGDGTTTITDFNLGQDVIHILQDINSTGVQTAQEILASHVTENAAGDAVLTFGTKVIVLDSIDMNSLNNGVFVID
jgi:Ca2+-binding RTX toxin-like protein